MISNREKAIGKFLKKAGWDSARRAPVTGDASARKYERLSGIGARKDERAVLMDAPSSLGGSDYAAIAKLADGEMAAFTGIGTALTQRGFSAPKILAADIEQGLLLLEDLGDNLVAVAVADNPASEAKIYGAAVDCLAAIYRSEFSRTLDGFGHSWPLRAYDAPAMAAEIDLMAQWYLPHKSGGKFAGFDDKQAAQWGEIWQALFARLDKHAPGLVLRDFHAENIFWLPERQAISRIGLIDFQDGLLGHPAYDLVSLIEDARRDVDPALTKKLIARFCLAAKIKNNADFKAAYAIMGAQRNAKILGIFVRLAKRDKKPDYLDMLPRVEAHFAGNLKHPVMADLRQFIEGLI
ncbi:MAG: phosphotransferase [Robiginitomaculum sp.]